jgi:CheY-like chemotaxis protein
MPTKTASRRPLRVLVVEDNPDVADVLSLLLRLWGHEAALVRTGTAALDAVPAYRPDVALVDILVPGLNGYDLARQLHERGLAGRTVLVAMTGLGEEVYRRRSREAGFAEHLVKPVEPARLREVLERLARERDRHRASEPTPA